MKHYVFLFFQMIVIGIQETLLYDHQWNSPKNVAAYVPILSVWATQINI